MPAQSFAAARRASLNARLRHFEPKLEMKSARVPIGRAVALLVRSIDDDKEA